MSARPEHEPLLAASSLLSSRWSRDNLLTPDPGRLYTGEVQQRFGVAWLQAELAALTQHLGPFEVLTGGLGVLSWSVRCRRATGDFLLQLPLVHDSAGIGGRTKREVPRACHDLARQFAAQGLDRYLLPAEQQIELSGGEVGASFSLPTQFLPLSMRLGAARVDLEDDAGSWVLSLGCRSSAELRRELMAALAYHYDPDSGTSLSDVLINDGDFLVQRAKEGSFQLKLVCARHRESGVDVHRFLLFLVQLMAYEDWELDDDLVGLPVVVGNPAAAFSGFVRGVGLRYADLGRGQGVGEELARAWLEQFGRSREGRGYQPWVERFLAGDLETEPAEPRCPWWNLVELEQRCELAQLHGESKARALSELVRQLEDAIGAGVEIESTVNDWNREEVLAFLSEWGVTEDLTERALEAWFAGWPYRTRRQLKQQLAPFVGDAPPPAQLGFIKGVASASDEGQLSTLSTLVGQRPPRVLANPECFGSLALTGGLAQQAVACFPSFEAFMDDALHHPHWGYYAHRVLIGDGGHFSTNPEILRPHYGRWLAAWAMELWSQLVADNKLALADKFCLIEFGAGNGRLARDFLDHVHESSSDDARWQAFAQVLDYRIYELSAVLRDKQQQLLGDDATICSGDARRPAAALSRDFPDGVRGLIVSNELPDAFGVHKLMLSADGTAQVVLVVPRLAAHVLENLEAPLASKCRNTDARLRAAFGWAERYPGHVVVDREGFNETMSFLYQQPDAQTLLDGVWFEEVRVPATCFSPVLEVLRAGKREYALGLAAEPSGVVQYVNVHAGHYMRELGQVLRVGQVMTIDYGDTTFALMRAARRGKFPFRIYCDEGDYHPRPNHPYTRPGAQDLTADVNFTDLALAGTSAGLELAFFGPERAIVGAEFPDVLAATTQAPFAKFIGNSVFKLLVLGRDASWCPSGVGMEQLQLFAEPSTLATACRSRVSAIAERLSG